MNPSFDASGSFWLGALPVLRRVLSEEASYARLLGALWASIALHAVLGSRIESLPAAHPRSRAPSEVSIQIVAPRPAPPAPAEPEPPPLPRAPPALKARPKLTPPPAPEVPAMKTAAPETDIPPPPELSGVTLIGDGPAAFTLPSGSGHERNGPLGAIGNAPPPPLATPLTARGPRVVPLGELGARPVPPSLAAALSRNDPSEARRRGIAGHASVRARIDADGVPRALRVVAESFAGFGSACRDTLAASRWAAPKDRAGHAVASEVLYTCRFVIKP
jgi:protein TonB